MVEKWAKIDGPPAKAEGDTYPKWVILRGTESNDYGMREILNNNPGSLVTLFEAVKIFRPATHISEIVRKDDF